MAGSKYAPDCLKVKDYGQRYGCFHLIQQHFHVIPSASEEPSPAQTGRAHRR
jgi:hypothetical protein